VAGLALALAACSSSSSSNSDSSTQPSASSGSAPSGSSTTKLSGTFTVYLDAAYTGTGAAANMAEVDGFMAGVTDVNNTGGVDGEKMVVHFVNDEDSTDTAVTEFDSYLASNPAPGQVITGIGNLTVEAALLPIAASHHLLTMNQDSGPLANPQKYPLNFSAEGPNDNTYRLEAQYVQQKGYKNVAIMVGNNAFGQTEDSTLTALLKQEGVNVTANVAYDDSTLDYTPYLLKLQASHPQAVLINMYGTSTYDILKDKKALGWSVPVLADQAAANTYQPGVIPTADVAGVVTPGPIVSSPLSADQTAAYKAAYDRFGHLLVAQGTKVNQSLYLYAEWWDVAHLAQVAADQAKSTNSQAVAKALESMQMPANPPFLTYPPVDGKYTSYLSFSPTQHTYGYGGYQMIGLNQLGADVTTVSNQINALH
jgi:branched-chain amino acid transport system substrate-binding protein